MTTNTASSTRQVIRWTATENDWSHEARGILVDHYRRGDELVIVIFTKAGAVREAERWGARSTILGHTYRGTGKRGTVLGWLTTEAPAAPVATDNDEVPNTSTGGACSHGTPYSRSCPQCMGPGPGVDPAAEIRAEFAQTARSIPAQDRAPEVQATVAQPLEIGAALADLDAHSITSRERRIVELEREVERLAGMDAGLAETQGRIAELERRLEQNAASYQEARARITELEDAPVRQHARRLVEALTAMRDEDGPARVSLPVSRAYGLLADTLGIDTRSPAPLRAEFAAAHAAFAERDQAAEPTAHPVVDDDPRRALKALGVRVRTGLPGERVEVRETAMVRGDAHPRIRVLGFLTDGVLRTDEGREAREVPAALVPAYVEAVRALSYPAPTARRTALQGVEAG
jgi:hypothetical protein